MKCARKIKSKGGKIRGGAGEREGGIGPPAFSFIYVCACLHVCVYNINDHLSTLVRPEATEYYPHPVPSRPVQSNHVIAMSNATPCHAQTSDEHHLVSAAYF